MSFSCLFPIVRDGEKSSHTNHTSSSCIISETREECYWRFILKRLKHNWKQNSLFKHDLIACILCSLVFSLSVRMLFSLCHCSLPFFVSSSHLHSLSAPFSDMTAITTKASEQICLIHHLINIRNKSESDLISTHIPDNNFIFVYSLTTSGAINGEFQKPRISRRL